jgi:8-oxo-dGTP pyrophosphatase MutT (NUDIX family)
MSALVRAAVLVPLQVDGGGEQRLVLIQRGGGAPRHHGQVAFPGGLYDAERDESLLATALREAKEEVGLAPEAVRVVGALPEQQTLSSNYLITPFVGEVRPGYQFRPDGVEVESVFTVPLSLFAIAGRREEMEWVHEGTTYVVPCVRADGHVVWGVTLRIIDELLDFVVKSDK